MDFQSHRSLVSLQTFSIGIQSVSPSQALSLHVADAVAVVFSSHALGSSE